MSNLHFCDDSLLLSQLVLEILPLSDPPLSLIHESLLALGLVGQVGFWKGPYRHLILLGLQKLLLGPILLFVP